MIDFTAYPRFIEGINSVIFHFKRVFSGRVISHKNSSLTHFGIYFNSCFPNVNPDLKKPVRKIKTTYAKFL